MCILKHSGCKSFLAAVLGLGAFAVASTLAAPASTPPGNQDFPPEHVRDSRKQEPALTSFSVRVGNREWSPISNESLALPSRPGTTTFLFGRNPLASNVPLRFRYQLDGYEQGWHERSVEMRMLIRFIDADERDIAERVFAVGGESPGWTGSCTDSPWIHRKEVITVPAGAAQFYVVISSAGPPAAVGCFAIRNLVVFPSQGDTKGFWLIPPVKPEAGKAALEDSKDSPAGWVRAGTRPANARVLRYSPDSGLALAIVDDNPLGHADWNTVKRRGPEVMPGTKVAFEWEEVYSIGTPLNGDATYTNLPAGLYRFRIEALTLMGVPTGRGISVPVKVPAAFWETSWFWVAAGLLLLGFAAGSWRVIDWQRMKRRVRNLEREHALEQDRSRIAQDIHDDLGARVTQIALLSSSAQLKPNLPDEARADFGAVFRLTQELVQALHETVWAVSPQNDHLDALASYICQMTNQMCAQAQLRCRLDVPDFSAEAWVTSQIRHHIIMAVKEAIHNVIKHARASEIQICVRQAGRVLTIQVSDNGCGFAAALNARGNGLDNIERRLHSLGGSSSVESRPGAGTKVTLEFPLPVP